MVLEGCCACDLHVRFGSLVFESSLPPFLVSGYLRCSRLPSFQVHCSFSLTMSVIDVKAQQIVIDALACDPTSRR